MGLKDLVSDEDGDEGSADTAERREKSSSDEPYKVIGSDELRKEYTERQWEAVKDVLLHEFAKGVTTVLNEDRDERFQILDEAERVAKGELDVGESEYGRGPRCPICGNNPGEAGVEIQNRQFCIHHTAGQISKEINEN